MWYNSYMTRIENLKKKIQGLYEAKNPNRADWADWLYEHHVFIVSENARKLAQRYDVNEELAMAAAMLHDIADAEMSRFDNKHEKRSLEIANTLLKEVGFLGQEVETIVNAIRYHGCHNGEFPTSPEGKVMATADAVAHLSTDFYDHALSAMTKEGKSLEEISLSALKKIERDFTSKIFFDEVREEVRADYERVKALFSK